MRRGVLALFALSALAFADLVPSKAAGAAPPGAATARFNQAIAAELSGDQSKRNQLLSAAVAADPDFAPARWRLGQIQRDGKWQSIGAATAANAKDSKLAEYRQRRDKGRDNLHDNVALAHWATRLGLPDEASAHWSRVIKLQPKHEEAIKKLALRRINNQWVAPDEFERRNQEKKAEDAAAGKWKPKLARIERALVGDETQRAAALAELRAIDDPAAIPTLRELFSQVDLRRPARPFDETTIQGRRDKVKNLELVGVLDHIAAPEATKALVYEAVLSPIEEVRETAITALSRRRWQHFVPQILAGMTAPIDARVTVTIDDGGRALYRRSYFREGPLADYVATYDTLIDAHTTWIVDTPQGRISESYSVPVGDDQIYSLDARAAGNRSAVDRINDTIARRNQRLQHVLRGATGADLAAEPTAWWRWWQNYNELYVPEEKPLYEQTYSNYYSSDTYSYTSYAPTSCFVAGTIVETKTGPQPIESIRIGDFVLAQNSTTGELAFKPVIQRTVRPAAPILAISSGTTSISMTRGHPLWVVGRNWQMAKQLVVGDRIYSTAGPLAVTAIHDAKAEETFNLVVADFHTYFVGPQQWLVHDNSPAAPTNAKLPGVP